MSESTFGRQLKPHGRDAVEVSDKVLFEGGDGETICRKLVHGCEVHALLRLPAALEQFRLITADLCAEVEATAG